MLLIIYTSQLKSNCLTIMQNFQKMHCKFQYILCTQFFLIRNNLTYECGKKEINQDTKFTFQHFHYKCKFPNTVTFKLAPYNNNAYMYTLLIHNSSNQLKCVSLFSCLTVFKKSLQMNHRLYFLCCSLYYFANYKCILLSLN